VRDIGSKNHQPIILESVRGDMESKIPLTISQVEVEVEGEGEGRKER